MAKVQTRRGISVTGPLYARFQAWCVGNDVAMSAILEELLADLESGPMPSPRERARDFVRASYPRATDEARLEKLRSWRVDAPSVVGPVGQGTPRLASMVRVEWPETVAELVYDSLPEMSDVGRSRFSSPLRPEEASTVLDAAITRMLDSYEALATSASHCAICRSRSKPFVPKLAGESVVAVCRACIAEGRTLSGERRTA